MDLCLICLPTPRRTVPGQEACISSHLSGPAPSDLQARVFQLAAEAPLGPGQEACISYHHGKSNEELMRDSGARGQRGHLAMRL